MKKIDAKKLAEDIDAIPGICADGKKGIKKLFENHFGVKFTSYLPLFEGARVLISGEEYTVHMLCDGQQAGGAEGGFALISHRDQAYLSWNGIYKTLSALEASLNGKHQILDS